MSDRTGRYRERAPHPDSPAAETFDWSQLGAPDPDSPDAETFDWSRLGAPHPHSPAGETFDWSSLGVLHPYCPAERAGADEIKCFKCPAGADRVEFERAVKMAEEEINKLSPERYIRRLNRLKNRTAKHIRAQKTVKRTHTEAREAWITNYLQAMPFLFQGLLEDQPSLTPKEAAASLNREFKRLHLEHRLDIGGGGSTKKFAGLGDSLINQSIGGQWEARLPALREYAEKAKRDGKDRMAIKLRICPEEARAPAPRKTDVQVASRKKLPHRDASMPKATGKAAVPLTLIEEGGRRVDNVADPPTRTESPALQKHLDAVEEHRQKYWDWKDAYGHKMRMEARGEVAAAKLMEKVFPDHEIVRGFDAPGIHNFDQVWVKYGPDGKPVEYIIVEAKGTEGARLGKSKKGIQMTQRWVEETIVGMALSNDPEARDLGTNLLKSLTIGPPPKLKGEVIHADADGRGVRRPKTAKWSNGEYN